MQAAYKDVGFNDFTESKYIGEYQYRDVVVPNGIPAVISDELFALAQQRLEKNRHAPATMKADIKYILSTKLRCGDCGGMMGGESGTNSTNNKVYHYYKCANAKKHMCGRKALRKADIEDIVIERTVKTVMNDTILDSIAGRVFEFQQRENTVLPLLHNGVHNGTFIWAGTAETRHKGENCKGRDKVGGAFQRADIILTSQDEEQRYSE